MKETSDDDYMTYLILLLVAMACASLLDLRSYCISGIIRSLDCARTRLLNHDENEPIAFYNTPGSYMHTSTCSSVSTDDDKSEQDINHQSSWTVSRQSITALAA